LFALTNPAMLVVPAIGIAAALLLVRTKTRHVNEGALFGNASPTELTARAQAAEGRTMESAERADTSKEQREIELKPFLPGMGSRLWIVALEGLIARYSGLHLAIVRSKSDEMYAAAVRTAAATVPQVVKDWQLVRATMTEPAAGSFRPQIQHLDHLVRLMTDTKYEGEPARLATQMIAADLQTFVLDMIELRNAAATLPKEPPKQLRLENRAP